VIGEDDWTGGGVTPTDITAKLESFNGEDVVVNIHSPGGSFFDGLAIYNLLDQYDGHVTTRVVGLAASAAGTIAMAGDTIQIADAGFLMVHNAWGLVVGNSSDMKTAMEELDQFDATQTQIFTKRTGLDSELIKSFLDAETWFTGSQAIEHNFADALLGAEAVPPTQSKVNEGDSGVGAAVEFQSRIKASRLAQIARNRAT
jgi:ATP-dependent protease ClpP protease subunit